MKNYYSKYTEKEEIGEGPIGTVKKIVLRSIDETRAIKIVDFNQACDESKLELLSAPLLNIKSPGLVNVFEVFYNSQRKSIDFIEEYLDPQKYTSFRTLIIRNSFNF
jgi:hypothetical protein